MRFRLTAVLLAAGLCVLPAVAQKKKAENSAETVPRPSTPAHARYIEPATRTTISAPN